MILKVWSSVLARRPQAAIYKATPTTFGAKLVVSCAALIVAMLGHWWPAVLTNPRHDLPISGPLCTNIVASLRDNFCEHEEVLEAGRTIQVESDMALATCAMKKESWAVTKKTS